MSNVFGSRHCTHHVVVTIYVLWTFVCMLKKERTEGLYRYPQIMKIRPRVSRARCMKIHNQIHVYLNSILPRSCTSINSHSDSEDKQPPPTLMSQMSSKSIQTTPNPRSHYPGASYLDFTHIQLSQQHI